MNIGSLVSKSLCLAWWSWVCFWCSCFCLIRLAVLGTMRSSLVLSFLFISSSAGVTPVVVWGVVLYLSRKRDNLSCMVPSSIFSIPSLKALTTCSACPFEASWYGNSWEEIIKFRIVAYDGFRETMGRDDFSQLHYGGGWCCTSHYVDIHPHGMSIDHHLLHVILIWPCIINVHPWPGLTGPLPWVEWCFCWGLLVQLALLTPFNCIFYLTIHVWPPHITTCKGFHPWYARMGFVKLGYDLCSSLRWYYHPVSPYKSSTFCG